MSSVQAPELGLPESDKKRDPTKDFELVEKLGEGYVIADCSCFVVFGRKLRTMHLCHEENSIRCNNLLLRRDHSSQLTDVGILITFCSFQLLLAPMDLSGKLFTSKQRL